MANSIDPSKEIFSFHLATVPITRLPSFLLGRPYQHGIPGLKHSESFFTMNLGRSIIAPPRYNFKTVALFAWWSEESFLSDFLNHTSYKFLADGWHVRMKLYRQWGNIDEINNAFIDPHLSKPNTPIVAVTLARLKLSETARFIKWGKPVEKQVKNHQGQNLALAALRPFNTFSTFSIWQTEADMLDMVKGQGHSSESSSHKLAMKERQRKDFHHEFTTMRFKPFKEVGSWNHKSDYTYINL